MIRSPDIMDKRKTSVCAETAGWEKMGERKSATHFYVQFDDGWACTERSAGSMDGKRGERTAPHMHDHGSIAIGDESCHTRRVGASC
jgi:hypothetical protein